jgi:hypothetical protein
MNVCREKEETSTRAGLKVDFVPALRCQDPKAEGLPTRECQEICAETVH